MIIGNSDGIGLGLTKELLNLEWEVTGLSRSQSPIDHISYRHNVLDVQSNDYSEKINILLQRHDTLDLCVYCAGIGDLLDFSRMADDIAIFEVNLMGLVKTVSCVLPDMLKRGSGHFMGISSVADEMLSAESPAYHASKAAFSNYLEGLALALKQPSVAITNVRFGFVDTKMAKGDVKPFMISVEQAVQKLLYCIEHRPIRYTAPKIIIPLVKFRSMMLKSKVK